MIVKVAIRGTDQIAGKSRPKHDACDMVASGRNLAVSLPGDVNKSVLVEVGILDEGLNEASGPVA